jgi:hypothetical protein
MHDPIETVGQKTIMPDSEDTFQIEWQMRGKTTGMLYVHMNGVTVFRIGPMPYDQVQYVGIPPQSPIEKVEGADPRD